jgi:hypothetical protein
VAFLADRDGEIDLFSNQLGTGHFENLTESLDPLNLVAILRWAGFSGDSARLWFNVVPGKKLEIPWSGGASGLFLVQGAHTPAWSSDDRLVYFNNLQSDSLWVADGAGRNARKLEIEWPPTAGTAAHNRHHA